MRYSFISKLIVIVLLVTLSTVLLRQNSTSADSLYSRKWMEYAMSVVEEERVIPPTTSARFYAYVASVYDDTLQNTSSQMQSGLATKILIQQMFPTHYDETNDYFLSLYNHSEPLEEVTEKILEIFTAQQHTDKYSPEWEGLIPSEEGYWYREKTAPLTPEAGTWKSWIVSNNVHFIVPQPPKFGSEAELAEVKNVANIVKNRTEEDNEKIMYWSAAAGTASPSGIWQDKLFSAVNDETTDSVYARKQKILAQSLADSFIAVWRVKYTYWTQRPSMRDPSILPQIENPPFPSYVSGHSAVSATAATILSKLEPEQAEYWMQQAKDASYSRVTAGIHFEYDTVEGFKLGEKVGNKIISLLGL